MNFADEFRRSWLITTFGIILYIVGIVILFWYEGFAMRHMLSLDETLKNTVSVDQQYDRNHEGKVVHIVGPILIGEPLTEPDYAVQVLAVKLQRRVQMYQWVEAEVERKFGDTVVTESEDRSYYYTKEWRNKLQDSRRFNFRHGHQNPTNFPIESRIQIAEKVTIGNYELGAKIKEKVNEYVEFTSDNRPEDSSIKLHMGLYYHCEDVFNPQVGDVRVQFAYAGLEGNYYSIVGKLENGVIVPYATSLKLSVLLVQRGEYSVHDVFNNEHYAQKHTTWVVRLVGWMFLFFAANCTDKFLDVLLFRNPLYGRSSPYDRHSTAVINLLVSLSFTLIITAVAWSVHRPWIGAGLILAALSPFVYFIGGFIGYNRLM